MMAIAASADDPVSCQHMFSQNRFDRAHCLGLGDDLLETLTP